MDIRNFVIIAHIDHGKSTLADRFLEITGTVEPRQMKNQYLDQLELERERGITIKMAPVRMVYRPAEILNSKSEILNKSQIQNSKSQIENNLGFSVSDLEFANSKQTFVLNLIDTPGHPDFSYEVSRALAAVEGAILLVDATKGIQAQTLANFRLAQKSNLKIIGAVNKVDMNPPQLENVIKETAILLNCEQSEILRVSGKTGEGVPDLLAAVVDKIPPPTNFDPRKSAMPARALIFDSFYDNHKGIIASVRLFNGELKIGDEIYFTVTHQKAKVKELGYFAPTLKKTEKLSAGEIGYIVSGIKEPEKVKIGDTIIGADLRRFTTQINADNIRENPRFDPRESVNLALPGYQEPTSVVFTSFYPEDANEYENFKKALAKLRLNDSSLRFEGDFNEVLGRGVKIGFLGKLHFEITSERLAREFNIKTVNTYPSIIYKIKSSDSTYIEIKNPEDFPDDAREALEQMVKLEIITPPTYLGNILQLKNIFHLARIETHTLGENTLIIATMPLRELIANFDDRLKSVSAGFASFSYELTDWQQADLRKMQILIAGEPTPGLTRIVSKEEGEREARRTVGKLKDLLPRQQFNQAIQAKIEGRIVARETVPALRKDVTGYLYGGDRTRKMKLWKKQKAGKKKLLARARVDIPIQVFKDLIK